MVWTGGWGQTHLDLVLCCGVFCVIITSLIITIITCVKMIRGEGDPIIGVRKKTVSNSSAGYKRVDTQTNSDTLQPVLPWDQPERTEARPADVLIPNWCAGSHGCKCVQPPPNKTSLNTKQLLKLATPLTLCSITR